MYGSLLQAANVDLSVTFQQIIYAVYCAKSWSPTSQTTGRKFHQFLSSCRWHLSFIYQTSCNAVLYIYPAHTHYLRYHNKSPRYVCMLHRDRNSRRGHAMNVVASSGTPANFTANPISRDPSSTISLRLNPDAGVTGCHANNNWRRKGSGDIKGE